MLHHTTRPSLQTSRWDDLDAAVRAVAGERANGRLIVAGDRNSGSLFFEDGHIIFGLSSTEDVADLIEPSWLETIGGSPLDLEASLASALSPPAVAARVGETIDRVIRALRDNDTTTIEFGPGCSPVRTRVAFGADEWFDLSPPTAFGLYRLTRTA